ncbi:hypothetical protein FGO68_gene11620 [Halteria grandinella]|uniref:Secreted protein n=1 Tax=Halteria grandinella TaxID=5974 RepID=A0A8J8SYL8_HALGN|nr:hypothetical protein FGO68_gene11620 [Halteria grandinella]
MIILSSLAIMLATFSLTREISCSLSASLLAKSTTGSSRSSRTREAMKSPAGIINRLVQGSYSCYSGSGEWILCAWSDEVDEAWIERFKSESTYSIYLYLSKQIYHIFA